MIQQNKTGGWNSKLLVVKIAHTIVWLFFNLVLLYLFYAGITDNIDWRTWLGIGLFAIEGLVLLIFKNICPLTIIARKYSDSQKDNFDIFLPGWLARYNKLIYSILLAFSMIIILYRLFT